MHNRTNPFVLEFMLTLYFFKILGAMKLTLKGGALEKYEKWQGIYEVVPGIRISGQPYWRHKDRNTSPEKCSFNLYQPRI